MFDGNAPFSVHDWEPSWQFCEWKSYEFSGGAEIGKLLRFRTGKGDIFLGAEGVWGRYDLEGIFLNYSATNAEDYFNTALASANGIGWQGHAGISYPIMNLNNRLTLNFIGLLKTGRIFLTPTELPEGGFWGSWSYPEGEVALPRWGVSAGLTLAFDSRVQKDTAVLIDATIKPVPIRGGCLWGVIDTTRFCLGGCCVTGGSLRTAQATTAFLLGPGIGIPFGLFGAMMMYDNPASWEIIPLAIGCYIWSPVGSYIGTMAGGRMFNPGGSWNYTLIGTFLGQVANLFLVEGYRIAVGANPWRGDADLSSMIRGPKKGTYAVISIASVLPTLGALIGYDISIKHADLMEVESEDMGYHRTWDEICKESIACEWNSRTDPQVKLPIIKRSF
ncbi:hypothetical protein CEE36_09650 [candidate division TA06 bacterium B3_TA06]|uniref:Uncharacterized protein n=1 Tax=candidate division TA06 bacterium B3_TA06 TaxID=2012487 RepID=A0A532UZ84_UNCT6|nr:MAG: hypothetical protein CEE36_09650 [candidate division TA06 bacterium B3_TA06]